LSFYQKHSEQATFANLTPVEDQPGRGTVVRGEQELLETWRYVEANPVRRSLADVAEAYRWSSAWQRQ
jgi:hypothetical protein